MPANNDDIEAKINEIIIEGAAAPNVKMEVDYSEVTDKKIPEAKAMAAKNKAKLEEALEILLSLEKQTRTGGDMHSTSKILVAIVQMCFEVSFIIIVLDHE